jgi:hypothetical protein
MINFVNYIEFTLKNREKNEKKWKLYYDCKVVKVTLTKNTTLQKIEQLSSIKCNCMGN